MNITRESYYVGNKSVPSQQNVLLQTALTDYAPDTTTQAGASSSTFFYNASSLYRLFCFQQSAPLYNISASIVFSDKNGNIWPLQLFSKQQCTLKFMFIKKHLIKNLLKGQI